MSEQTEQLLDTCPYCQHRKATLYRAHQTMRDNRQEARDFYKCSECGTVYPRPRSVSYYADFVPELVEPIKKISPLDFAARFYKRLKGSYGVKKALDIGSNTGYLCYLLSTIGIEAVGLETQKEYVDFANQKGIKTYQGSFPNIPEELKRQKFDMITCNATECYFTEPMVAFRSIYDLLVDNGIFALKFHAVTSHDYRSDRSLFIRVGNSVQGFPTLESLRYNLSKLGFKVMETVPYPENYFYFIFKFKLKYIQRIFDELYYLMMGQRLLKNADYIVIIARK